LIANQVDNLPLLAYKNLYPVRNVPCESLLTGFTEKILFGKFKAAREAAEIIFNHIGGERT